MNQQRVFAYILWFQKEICDSIQRGTSKQVRIEKFARITILLPVMLHICDRVTMSLDVTEAAPNAKGLA